MGPLYKTRLFRTQFFALVGITFVFFGAICIVVLLKTRSTIEERELEAAAAYRHELALYLESWIHERESDVGLLAAELSLDDSESRPSSELGKRLALLMQANSSFDDVFTVDGSGYIDTSSSGVEKRSIYVGDRDYVKAAREGRNYMGGYYKSRITGEASFIVSFPLASKKASPIALVGVIPLQKIVQILDAIDLGNMGSVYLVDDSSRIVSNAEFLRLYKVGWIIGEDFVRNNFATQELAAGRAGSAKYPSLPGQTVYGSFDRLSGLSLGLVVEFASGAALRPIVNLLEFCAVFALAMLVVLILISWILTSRLVGPLGALIAAEENIAKGQFIGPLELKTNTEFDQLVELFNRMEAAIREREASLRESAARDSLTGLYNHGRVEEFLEVEMRRNRRSNGIVSFVMLDIDFFKRINDDYGHQAGDEILRRLARILEDNVREGDLVGRYGGEEFAIILTSSPPEVTRAFCERLRHLIEMTPFTFEDKTIMVTVSIGWTAGRPTSAEPFDIIQRADKALYAAKALGRNAVRGRPEWDDLAEQG